MGREKKPAADTRGYHHGELRAALVEAADAIIRESGIEGFSLREAARRAGVSPGAPMHHFGNAAGLLTEVAILGYRDLRTYLERSDNEVSPSARLRSLATHYVMFALDHPGRFRLMFRKDLIRRTDERYKDASRVALSCFADAAAMAAGTTAAQLADRNEYGPVLAAWATAHGIANLALEDKMAGLLKPSAPVKDFVDRLLPSIVAAQWPEPPPTAGRRSARK